MEIEKKRKSIPLSIQLEAAKRQIAKALGVDVADLRLDHDPALNFRPMNEAGDDTVPPANDPAHLFWIADAAHKIKTFGIGGERRVHTKGSDLSEPRRLDKLYAKIEDFRARVLSVEKKPKPRKSKWPSRKFETRKMKP